MAQYIYLLQTREFMSLKEPIYKIGKTTKAHFTRFNQYPKGSCLLFHMICTNCHTLERQIIKLFKTKYTLCKDIGLEYFKGCYNNMINDIYNLINIKADIIDEDNLLINNNEDMDKTPETSETNIILSEINICASNIILSEINIDLDDENRGTEFIGYTDTDILLTYNDTKPPEIKQAIIDTLKDFCQKHMHKYNDVTSKEYKYYTEKASGINNDTSKGIIEFSEANEFITNYFAQFKPSEKLEFNINGIDVAKYLGITFQTLKKLLLNAYVKTNCYFINIDFIRVKKNSSNAITYYLNHQSFERLAMTGNTKESEIIRQYFINSRKFITAN